MILIKKDKELTCGTLDKISILLNILVIVIGFPFILIVSSLSEILAEVSSIQQLLYFSPALTVIGIAASVTLRRMGHTNLGFLIQFAGPDVSA